MDQSYSIIWLCLLEVPWASVKHWISSCWAIAVPQVHLVPAKTRIRNAWTKRAGHGELSDSSMCSAMYDHVCHVHSCGSSVSFARHTCCNWSLRRQHRREMQIWLGTCCVGVGQTMVKSSCNTISQGWTYMCCLPAILKLWAAPGQRWFEPIPRNCTKKHMQVFADVYHLDTLEKILSTCAQVRCQGSVEGPVVVFRIQYNLQNDVQSNTTALFSNVSAYWGDMLIYFARWGM
jgi:hypothetical protein